MKYKYLPWEVHPYWSIRGFDARYTTLAFEISLWIFTDIILYDCLYLGFSCLEPGVPYSFYISSAYVTTMASAINGTGPSTGGDAIAIIGMATRFPQEANSNDNLWKFLLKARSSMTPIPSDRANHEAHYHPDAEHGGTVSELRTI